MSSKKTKLVSNNCLLDSNVSCPVWSRWVVIFRHGDHWFLWIFYLTTTEPPDRLFRYRKISRFSIIHFGTFVRRNVEDMRLNWLSSVQQYFETHFVIKTHKPIVDGFFNTIHWFPRWWDFPKYKWSKHNVGKLPAELTVCQRKKPVAKKNRKKPPSKWKINAF